MIPFLRCLAATPRIAELIEDWQDKNVVGEWPSSVPIRTAAPVESTEMETDAQEVEPGADVDGSSRSHGPCSSSVRGEFVEDVALVAEPRGPEHAVPITDDVDDYVASIIGNQTDAADARSDEGDGGSPGSPSSSDVDDEELQVRESNVREKARLAAWQNGEEDEDEEAEGEEEDEEDEEEDEEEEEEGDT